MATALDKPIHLREWRGALVDTGAVLQLVYSAPTARALDIRAFDELLKRPGVTSANAVTAFYQLPGGGSLPTRSYKRVSDQLIEFWVVTSRSGVLGQLITETLRPQPGVTYRLQVVNRWRQRSNFLQAAAAKGQDAMDNVGGLILNPIEALKSIDDLTSRPADALREKLEEIPDAIPSPTQVVLSLAIPIVIGLVLYSWVRSEVGIA